MKYAALVVGGLMLLIDPVRAADRVDFAHDILPLLKARCAECHTDGKHKGDVSFDTRATLLKSRAAVPGKSANSKIIRRVTNPDRDQRMPPKGPPLSATEVALLRAWIDEGIDWQPGFSFSKTTYIAPLKPRRPILPLAQEGRDNPIDRIVDAYRQKKHVATPSRLDDAAFARRVYLDLVGLLPTPEQLATFLADSAPDKRARFVDTVLANRRAYAEHWLTFWNDMLRNDYQGTGYIDGGRKQITGWLYRSILENKPYDQFVRELISPTPESEGFIKGIKWRGRVNASQVPEIQFAQNISQVFLGTNLKCASCHDSFINDWKLADAYGLAAIITEKPPEMYRCDKPTGVKAQVKFLYPEIGTIDPTQPPAKRLQRLADLMTSPDNGRLTRTIVNRLWQRLMGRGIVHPVDVMDNEPWSADLLDYLATYLSDHGYDLKKVLALIASSQTYQSRCPPLATEPPAERFVFTGPMAKRLTAEQFIDAIWRMTGTAPSKLDKKTEAAVGDRGGEPVRASLVHADRLTLALGRPIRDQVVTTRPEEVSTLEALDLTNGQALADLLDKGAKNLRKRHPDWSAQRMIEWIYVSTLARRPTVQEMDASRALVGMPLTDEGLGDFLWAVLMLPEFQLVR